MESSVIVWTDQEVEVARRAFDSAYERAITTLIRNLQQQASQLSSADSVWQLHDFLSIQRHGIEGRFDFRLEGILFVFASLVKEGLLEPAELQGLDREKHAKVMAMSRF
ncbi:MAG: hypothetical protein VKO65_00990 [Cyanobacteriota bacterium]|nr:hypothetical protein [Cyanobacteriota bacterium]